MSWALHRIDDRLIHGQVLVAWGARLDPARIWVVDDGVAASEWERDLFREAAPGIDVRVASVAEAAAAHAGETEAPRAAFLLVRDLDTARRLADAGARVAEWNVGGLHYAPGKEKVNDYVYLDERDRESAKALMAGGARLIVQDVPASRPLPLGALDPALAP
ncbi:MAG TPA: PTS sugar transporter subunit IIB [Methylomirabilota bacterium]|nr:PTS sugar transporter subunit IIB [Methylomirabilota bacterium]